MLYVDPNTNRIVDGNPPSGMSVSRVNPSLAQYVGLDITEAMRRSKGITTPSTTVTPTATPTATAIPTAPAAIAPSTDVQVVPGGAAGATQMNIADYSGQLVTNPSLGLTQDDPATTTVNESMNLSQRVPDINQDAAGTNINADATKYQMDPSATNATAATGTASTAAAPTENQAATYEAQTTQQNVAENGQMEAAQGQVDPRAEIEAPQIDTQGLATGTNADGSVNYTGQALNESAQLDLDDIDARATTKGQLAELQADFTGPNGEPVIPNWAQATARSISKIAAFRGMTGTAAVAAMSQALMEASLPIAQQDAQFFQTVTLQNLNNKQQSTINKANVLAKMDQVNADNRLAAAIQNSKNFMDMDLRNLDNAQQAALINTQARIQSILEDAKAVNAQRLFSAEATNDMAKFYDELSATIEQFNANQLNQMSQFNAGELNSMEKFNSELETQREQFYKTMQYNIDLANAKWRQSVTLQESEMNFEAAATDVKNMVGLSVEQMNQLWDRSDSLLDYLWKSTENELDRKAALSLEKFRAKSAESAADSAGWGSIFGSIAGAVAGSDQFLDFLF